MKNFAIVETGGKQYRVEPGTTLRVESLKAEPGTTVELDNVLAIASDGDISLGSPSVENARVVAEVLSHSKGKKVIIFKYKAKTRNRKKKGHRQGYTELKVKEILTEKVEKKRRRRTKKSEEPEDGS